MTFSQERRFLPAAPLSFFGGAIDKGLKGAKIATLDLVQLADSFYVSYLSQLGKTSVKNKPVNRWI